jgi:transcription termination factor NusB
MSQKRKYVRRQKKNNPTTSMPTDTTLDVEQITKPSIISNNSTSIISEQDEEYEISVIMDIIKIQEKEEKEKKQNEIEQQKKYLQELHENIKQRDNNIKDILRKIKIGNNLTDIEKNIVNILETFMETQETHIHINDYHLYQQISSYLGTDNINTKGIIRLTDDIKLFAKNLFIPPN